MFFRTRKNKKRYSVLVLLILAALTLSGCRSRNVGDDTPITSISDLNGKTVVVQKGTPYAELIKENEALSDVKIEYYLSNSDGLAMLVNGKADALVTDFCAAQAMANRYSGFVILNESLDTADYGFAFRKGDPVMALFSEVIREMKKDGRLAAITNKWLGGDYSQATLPEQDWPGLNGTLDCQVSPEMEPICYPDGTDVTGLDVDLLLNIARELDYHITFTTNYFSDMLPQLVAGYTDIVGSALTITDERKESVDFTESYLSDDTVLLVRRGGNTSGEGFFLSLINSFRRVFAENGHWQDILMGIGRTLLLTVLTVTTGLIFGSLLFVWGYTESRISKTVISILSWLFTMMPTSTWLLIMYYIVFAGQSGSASFWAATIAFTVYLGFTVCSLLQSNVDGVGIGQSEAAYSMGYSRFKALRLILIPQALPGFLDDLQNAVVCHIKDTSIVGMITVLDIQQVADLIRAETMDPFLTLIFTAVIYILLCWGGSALVRSIRLSKLFAPKTEADIRKKIMKGMTK